MAMRLQDRKEVLLSGAVTRLHEKLEDRQAKIGETFLRHYYRSVSPNDLIDRDALDVYGAALAHLRFGENREAGKAKVRVYNPQIEQHGWQSTHTSIEVVTDDMPFLVDSVTMAMKRLGLIIHLIIHPVIPVSRDEDGTLLDIKGLDKASKAPESFMHIEVDRQSDPARLEHIRHELEGALNDVRATVDDWQLMLAKVDVALDDLSYGAAAVPPDELNEARAFLEWIAGNHFTFIGYRSYDLVTSEGEDQLKRTKGSALGVLRHQPDSQFSESFATLPPEVKRQARMPIPLVITKANSHSTIHRPVYLDYLGVKRFDKDGKVIGEHRFLGLFTSAAYNRHPNSIPLLRHKVRRLIERAKLAPNSHAGKAFANILETYPRDELFQTGDDDLFHTVMETLHLQERQRIRLFMRRDAFARFASCLVYVPRDRYNTELRRRFQDILEHALSGEETEYQVQVSESTLARIHFIVRTPKGINDTIDLNDLENQLVAAARSWSDGLRDALIDTHGEEEGNRRFRVFGSAFPIGYQEQVPARAAVPDIDRLNDLIESKDDLALSLFRPLEDDDGLLRLKIGRNGAGIPLSDVLPILEDMGLRVIDEQPHEIRTAVGTTFWLHDFGMQPKERISVKLEKIRPDFQETFKRIWRGDIENDGFNQLVLHAHLSWRQVNVLRAYCKYLLQIDIPFSQSYMEQTLARNPELTRLLAELFEVRFDPGQDEGRNDRMVSLEAAIREGLEAVNNLDEDRILRRYMRLILATLRTNHYQRSDTGGYKSYLSLKIDPAAVPEMPLPRPAFEIFVYSPKTEGVHLRGGRVARGGLRWSDRQEDFRTEVLGLMKAQMVKNGVIVPVGAKGGFIVKRPPKNGDRGALQTEVITCYRTLISGMLDITDNRRADGIEPPDAVVRYDEDDPYLVVAADKGTATFSDIANEISLSKAHWLGDAFASGGSVGYDHKKMGITAKGAWESVKRHFIELGKDCQREPFTAVGIGDMSGDVFGNGMLLSEQTKLIAAFDHRHIFIDPNPNATTSFEERQRLFSLPRSSWDDYDRSKISRGGGVFARSLKSIPLTSEICEALCISDSKLAPHELIRAILLAPVELFWNGGIGTYVKSSEERNADAFDRANDPVRVDGNQLRCKIVGEGGNLGLTQKGRIEFSQHGGRINTDFIDNAAGVDCSDHEVNIKILLSEITLAGDMTNKQRDELLSSMTTEVEDLVLRNNILQVQAISHAETNANQSLDDQIAFMRRLEAAGRLDRQLEVLPSDESLNQRKQSGVGFYRPEISVLLAYAKTTLYEDLLDSDLPDDTYLHQDLIDYFPRPLRQDYQKAIKNHRLGREIVATIVANDIVNLGLGEFIRDLSDQSDKSIATLARSFITARDAFSLAPLIRDLEKSTYQIGAKTQIELLNQISRVLLKGTEWFQSNLASPIDIHAGVDQFQPGIIKIQKALKDILGDTKASKIAARKEALVAQGVNEEAAGRYASLDFLLPACEIVTVAEKTGIDVVTTGRAYFALDSALQIGTVFEFLNRFEVRNQWDRLAVAGLCHDIIEKQRLLTIQALGSKTGQKGISLNNNDSCFFVIQWLKSSVKGHERWGALLAELQKRPKLNLSMLMVVVRALGQLAAVGQKLTLTTTSDSGNTV